MSHSAETMQTMVYTPGEAARILGVTTQSLRRYAEAYGEVFGEVPQHAGQRVFDDAFIERVRAAQALQQANTVPSIRAGLEAVRDNAGAGEVIAGVGQQPFEQVVLERLDALAQMIVQLQVENQALHRQLEAPKDTERMNAYLLGELERRAKEGTPKRPWWRRLFG